MDAPCARVLDVLMKKNCVELREANVLVCDHADCRRTAPR
jgi:hypothetical protein